MEIKRKYLQKYLHNLAIDQLTDDYREKGYQVSIGERFGKYEADLVVRKGTETIVLEVKSTKLTQERKAAIAAIADDVRSRTDYQFLVVVATPPVEKEIEFDGIELLLFSYLLDHLPNELDETSTHTTIEEVSDVEIDVLKLSATKITIAGSGLIGARLQIGSDGDVRNDDGFVSHENFPFTFSADLSLSAVSGWQIDDLDDLEIDTSTLYS